MAAQITGICTIDVDGQRLETLEGSTIDIGGYENTPHTGYVFYGHSRKKMPSKVTCKIVHKANTDLVQISNWFNATITFTTDTGVVLVVSSAAISAPPVLTSDGGEVALEFSGEPAIQQ